MEVVGDCLNGRLNETNRKGRRDIAGYGICDRHRDQEMHHAIRHGFVDWKGHWLLALSDNDNHLHLISTEAMLQCTEYARAGIMARQLH